MCFHLIAQSSDFQSSPNVTTMVKAVCVSSEHSCVCNNTGDQLPLNNTS